MTKWEQVKELLALMQEDDTPASSPPLSAAQP